MHLNKFFLSSHSVVNYQLNKSSIEVKEILNINFPRTRNNPFYKTPNEYRELTSDFAFSMVGKKLRIHFAKELKSEINYSFHVNYPRFIGELYENDGKAQLRGFIGFRNLFFILPILWLAFFIALSINWYVNPSNVKDGEYVIYFLDFGLIISLIGLIRARRKVFEMRRIIDELFEEDAS